MSDGLVGRTAHLKVRVKAMRHPAEPFSPKPIPHLPRLRPSEVAAMAGLEAVRRALDDLLARDVSA